ncbi:MAG: SLBB domain-containing protein [Burkholderiales bacterium]|nr:SLBB domain-containing protein [Burkholderiales bacterium]
MNSFSNTRKLGLVLLISGFAFAPLGMALAQTQNTGNAALLGAAQGQTPTHGGTGAAGMSGLAQPGLQQPGLLVPTIPPRPDFGAQDAQRNNLSPLRSPRLPQPSQFQKFVQESTGKLLPLFGASLFENPMAYAADAAAPAPSEYVLGPGDEVRIQIWGTVDFAGNQTLDRNGQINLPKIGAITLGGVQVKDLESVLKKQIGTVFNNVNVNAALGKLRGMTVYVVGQANQPGTYNLNSLSTLVNAVFASGGPNTNGSMRQIELKRGGRTITTLDLYDFIAKGDKSKDAALQPGDVIMIPPAGPRMALVGATDHGAIYELKAGAKVKDVLALGGGLSALASQQKAMLERIGGPAQQAQYTSQANRQVQNLVLNAQGLDVDLKDGDLLVLLPISPAFANAITLQGTVAQSLRHPWTANMRVSDLIPDRDALITPDYYKRKNKLVQGIDDEKLKDTKDAGASVANRINSMVDQINWDYAVVERLNTKDLRVELIPFNLGKAVLQKDPAHNLALQPGDVVTIMSSTDVQLPAERKTRLVRIEGEVAAPGVYQAKPGETLPQLLQRVGGLTPQAYLYGTEFTRESVRKQQQENLDQVIRRLEAQSATAGATLAANLSADRAAQAAQAATLQQQQQQQMQAQIARLRAMKSKGRVSLELDPDKQNLPNLPLEDGDTILVPTLPAFVSAAGSVNNDNVFIFRQGKTVGDVITSAGVNEDSELSQAFVLRADGSIFSRKAAGWFTSFESAKLMPGDTVVVPSKVDRESGYNTLMRGLRDWTQIFSNLGIGAAAIRTLRN